MNEVSYIIGKILAGHEGGKGAPRGVDHGLAFKVTLQADRVSLAGDSLAGLRIGAAPPLAKCAVGSPWQDWQVMPP